MTATRPPHHDERQPDGAATLVASHPPMRRTPLDAQVAIIGAGFGGLGMAVKLQEAGRDSFVILEAASEVGGTWRDNTYPGCACDVPSHLYSYSFDKNPGWSHHFARQPEILNYIKEVTEKHGLREHIRFGAKVASLTYLEDEGIWRIALEEGAPVHAETVVMATGPLSKPVVPPIKGRERFEGPQFHSAQWRHDVELAGRAIAVIGTGASAIQFVPEIAPQAANVTVYQRTPPWIVPRPDRTFSDRDKDRFAQQPWRMEWMRRAIYARLEWRAYGFVKNPAMLRWAERFALRHLAEQVPDPELRAKLTPDYSLGCKRILLSNDWYPTLMRDNVELVTEPIEAITPGGVRTVYGREREADVLIYGTGFDTVHWLGEVTVTGRGGADLGALWQDRVECYLGSTVSGFPNFFMIIGPNTGLGHNSMVYMIESQTAYILSALRERDRRNAYALDVKPRVQHAFYEELKQRLAGTVWSSGCKSWYITEDGANPTIWPGFTFSFRRRTRHIDPDDYVFFAR